MFFKIYFIFFLAPIVISVQLDLNNKASIFDFLSNMELRAITSYKLFETLPNKQNMEILNLIHRDMLEKLSDLENISSHSEYHRSNFSEWKAVMNFLGTYGFKEIDDSYSLYSTFALEIKLNHLHDNILKSIETIREIGNPSSFYTVENFCSIAHRITNSFLEHISEESVDELYETIVEIVSAEVNSLNSKERKIITDYCNETISFQKAFYEYYRQMIKTYIQHITINFFYGLLNKRCDNIPIQNPTILKKKTPNSVRKMIQKASKIMNSLNYNIYNCDSPKNSENHIELKRIMTIKLFPEKYLSRTQQCGHQCDLEKIGNYINNTDCQEYRNCYYIPGHVHSCDIESDSCKTDPCGYCVCNCIINSRNSTQAITAINLREQVSDIAANKVVIGLKFSESSNMIHINILESTLLETKNLFHGIKKSFENIEYNEVSNGYHILHDNGTITPLLSGVDFGYPGIMLLDDVIAPSGHVVTGVRFKFDGRTPENHAGTIQLQIRVTPFDFKRNRLVDLEKTRWISADSAQSRSELMLELDQNLQNSFPNQFIRFQASEIRTATAQIIPFFDGQVISRTEPPPLGGIGLFYRKSSQSLAFRIFDANLSKLLKIQKLKRKQ